MITVYKSKKEFQSETFSILIVPDWKHELYKQLYKCIKLEYSTEIDFKFESVKNIDKLCKQISKSVLNSIYEEDILKTVAEISNIKDVLNLDDKVKTNVAKKLKEYFLNEELEFLRDEINDSISRIKKEWLNL